MDLPNQPAPEQVAQPHRQSRWVLWGIITVILLAIIFVLITFIGGNNIGARLLNKKAVGGGKTIEKLSSTGLRSVVKQKGVYLVTLPVSENAKKVEVCQTKGTRATCRTVAGNVKGTEVQINVPSLPAGPAFLRVTERDASGAITGREVFRRNLTILAVANKATEENGGGGSGGGGGGGGGSSGGNNQGPSVPSAEFVVPVDDEVVTANVDMDTRVKLTDVGASNLSCQEWILDGKTLTNSDWVDGQSPDLSEGACN